MKNKELIEYLQKCSPESPVHILDINSKNSGTFKIITNIVEHIHGAAGVHFILNGNTPAGENYIKAGKPMLNIKL